MFSWAFLIPARHVFFNTLRKYSAVKNMHNKNSLIIILVVIILLLALPEGSLTYSSAKYSNRYSPSIPHISGNTAGGLPVSPLTFWDKVEIIWEGVLLEELMNNRLAGPKKALAVCENDFIRDMQAYIKESAEKGKTGGWGALDPPGGGFCCVPPPRLF